MAYRDPVVSGYAWIWCVSHGAVEVDIRSVFQGQLHHLNVAVGYALQQCQFWTSDKSESWVEHGYEDEVMSSTCDSQVDRDIGVFQCLADQHQTLRGSAEDKTICVRNFGRQVRTKPFLPMMIAGNSCRSMATRLSAWSRSTCKAHTQPSYCLSQRCGKWRLSNRPGQPVGVRRQETTAGSSRYLPVATASSLLNLKLR